MRNEVLSAGYPSEIAEHWEKAERIRLVRVKQQRQRMGEMINIIEQYSRVIRDLQLKNKLLSSQNQKLIGSMTEGSVTKNVEFQNLERSYLKLRQELQKERKTRYECQNTIEALRKQLTSPQLSLQSTYSASKKNQLELNYDVLLTLYEELKDEIYLLQKENLTLKQVIKEQSKASYGKQAFWKENPTEKSTHKHGRSQKQNRPGIIRTSSHASIKESNHKQDGSGKILTTCTQKQCEQKRERPLHETNAKKLRLRDLQVQIKKQAEIIEKYRQNQDQQIKLIDLLKSQKTKVCACHSQGSSKKLLTSSKGGIVSFKKEGAPGST